MVNQVNYPQTVVTHHARNISEIDINWNFLDFLDFAAGYKFQWEACEYERLLKSPRGGVNRQNLKIINLSTHYKPGLALEQILRLGERGKQINQEIMRMNTMICFIEVQF